MLNTGCLLSSDLCYTHPTDLKTLELEFSVQVRFRPAGLQGPQVQQEDGRPQQTRIIRLSGPTCASYLALDSASLRASDGQSGPETMEAEL